MTCRCSSSQAHSLSNGRAASPGSFLSSSGYLDNDLDDAILARSDEEKPDSPTGLSREAEDELIAEDRETSPCFVAIEVNRCEDVKSGSLLACPESAQPPRALDEVESTKPLPQTGSSASSSEVALFTNDLEKYLNKSSQNQAEFGAKYNGFRIPEVDSDVTASLNPERGLPGKIDNDTIKTVANDLPVGSQLVAEHESFGAVVEQSSLERQTSLSYKQLRGKNTSNPLPEKELDTIDLHAVSTRVNGQRKDCVEAPDVKKTNRQEVAKEAKKKLHPSVCQPLSNVEDSIFCVKSSPVKPKRILIQEADLELRKARYVNAVLNHATSVPSLIDPVQELHTLVNTVASESSYNHPTDLTVRNYSKRSHSKTQRFSLNQWVEHSRSNFGRFDGIPDHFERSPILS
ncbi:PREDICTED: S100P-binding protein isoform X1 [Thamnophis sirtalis]|uniref:S100P-binding protein n=1 Tax=Thamnophis sirtalis TaxID=35019 RepID=A0A6I9Y5H4_9SAUR|nr:PREDICTED: S100P-binding protein isoform X1 [Thamnophis sirtalis]